MPAAAAQVLARAAQAPAAVLARAQWR